MILLNRFVHNQYITAFLQNKRFNRQLTDLNRFLKDGTLKIAEVKLKNDVLESTEKRKTAVNVKNIGISDGPLGELSSEYPVKVGCIYN